MPTPHRVECRLPQHWVSIYSACLSNRTSRGIDTKCNLHFALDSRELRDARVCGRHIVFQRQGISVLGLAIQWLRGGNPMIVIQDGAQRFARANRCSEESLVKRARTKFLDKRLGTSLGVNIMFCIV